MIALDVLDNLRLSQGWTITRSVPIAFTIDSQSYINSLGTLAQLAGIFLGLYFTAVSVVASTIYANVPGDIRGLFIRETGNNFYLHIVVTFIIADVVLIITTTLGHQLGNLNLSLIVILGFLVILGFFRYGLRSFDLFDPARLTSPLISDILEYIQEVSPKGFKWKEPSFQEFYQRHAEDALDTYYNVARMTSRDDHLQPESLKRLSVDALNLLQIYAQIKPYIPSESLWYKRTFQHQDWLTSEMDTVNLALQTGTTIWPKMKPDIMWFESHIEKIVIDSLRNLVDRRNYNNAYELEDSIWRTLDVLAENLSAEEALHLFNAMKEIIFIQAHNTEVDLEKLSKNADDFRLILRLIDLYGLALISILLGFSKRIRSMSYESFGISISKIHWDRPNAIYENAFPRPVIQMLEEIQKGIKFELMVEGRIISPQWYQQQLAAQSIISFFSKIIEMLVTELESSFTKEIELLIKEERYIVAAQLIQRGLEACSKFEANFKDVRISFEGLNNFHKTDDIQWPTPEWEKLDSRISVVRENLVIAFARSLIPLLKLDSSLKLPDYFGQGYLVVAEECYNAMAAGDEDKFTNIIAHFFLASVNAPSREFLQLNNCDDNTRFILRNETIMDLFAISGFSIVYSELDGKNYWKQVKNLWDKYYDMHSDPLSLTNYFKAVFNYNISIYSLLALLYRHESLRLKWKGDLKQQLRSRGLLESNYTYYTQEDESLSSRHQSPIIRTLTQRSYEFDSLEGVFFALYIMKRPEAKEIDWNRFPIVDLADAFADEESKDPAIKGEAYDKA